MHLSTYLFRTCENSCTKGAVFPEIKRITSSSSKEDSTTKSFLKSSNFFKMMMVSCLIASFSLITELVVKAYTCED